MQQLRHAFFGIVALVSSLLISQPAAAQTYTPLCSGLGSGTKQCVGALAQSSGGWGFPTNTGLTPGQVAIVNAMGGISLNFLSASNLPNAAGDVTGPYSALTVVGIQGRAVSSTAPLDLQVLRYSSGLMQWVPTTLAGVTPSGPAGGDLGGTYPNPLVTGIQAVPVSSAMPLSGQALVYNGTQYAPTTIVTSGGTGSNVIIAISDVAAAACQVAKRLSTGHVTLATGNLITDGDLVIGVYAAAVGIGGMATIIKSGGFASCSLTAGKVFRKSDATLVAFASLTTLDFTNPMGVASTSGLDVRVGEGLQVP